MDWVQSRETVTNGIRSSSLEGDDIPIYTPHEDPNSPLHPSTVSTYRGSPTLPVSPPIPITDLRSLEYTNSIDENLICPVCRLAFVDPVTTSCDHVFCRDCFEQSYAIAKLCPIDRKPLLVPHDLGPTHRIILNQLDSLEVRCPNKMEGCEKLLPRSMVQNHVSKYCDYTTVHCNDPTCGRDLLRRDVDRNCLHNDVACPDCGDTLWQLDLAKHRSVSCEKRKANCGLCGLAILRMDAEEHLLSCEESWTDCKWSEYGCSYRCLRKDLTEHRKLCQFEMIGPVINVMKAEIKTLRGEVQYLNEKDRIKDRRLRFLECTRSGASNTDQSHFLDLSFAEPTTLEPGPHDSRDQYMLSLLEHHESQVDRLSAGMTELEAKQTMMLFNETLPIKEQLAEIRSTQSTLGMHVRWLMQFRLKDSRGGAAKTAAANATVAVADKPVQAGPAPKGPVRRSSSELRENITKL